MLILSDDYADEDLIGHDDYCDGLVEIIRSVESCGSFTIGVYGQWGSGKTSLLKQIQNTLDYRNSDDLRPIVTVWFNPWQFISEEHLIVPFFHTLIAALSKKTEESKKEKWAENVSAFVQKIVQVPLALTYGLETEFNIFFLKAKLSGAKVMDHQKEEEKAIDKNRSKKKETAMQVAAQQYESMYYNLFTILQEAADNLAVKIVVFIDDLDRCLPEKAVQLLEGLKVLLDLHNFVFVMGVAQEVIERGIRVRYRELFLAGQAGDLPNIEGQYLDKIIQFPFSLPSADSSRLRDDIIRKQLEKMKGAVSYVDIVHESLGNNPRTIKRFINAVSWLC